LEAAKHPGFFVAMNVKIQSNLSKGQRGQDQQSAVRPTAPPASDSDTVEKPKADLRIKPYATRVAIAMATVAGILLLWWAVAVLGNYPSWFLPTPALVGQRIWSMLLDGSLEGHFWTTVREAGLG